MIRRQVGHEWWLITQHDHALLAGELARHMGNAQFMGFDPLVESVLAVDLHDCGWPAHDDHPTLNPDGLPLDVFETPRSIGLPIWESSARLAAERDAYAGLLVSLHSLSLSVLASTHAASSRRQDEFNLDDMRARFELNRFQHGQSELQHRLRDRLGLSTDIPLRLGLAETSNDPAELRLIHNFRLLQAMDQLSLCICCTDLPVDWIGPVHPFPGAGEVHLRVNRSRAGMLALDPWPFDEPTMQVSVRYRRLPVQSFTDEQAFQAAYLQAPLGNLQCQVTPKFPVG